MPRLIINSSIFFKPGSVARESKPANRIKPVNTAVIKATTWLELMVLANIPMAAYTAARKNSPMPAPSVPPLSILPVVSPRTLTDI